MIKISSIFIILVSLLMAGCTDAFFGKLSSYDGSANIKCYSGTRLIYDGNSTGKVFSSASSDGYYFVDAKTKKLKEVSGNCDITYTDY